ncbi:MAG TPA: hypothetical protein VFE14_05955 [Micromonosporaceae bacterium]|jgi:hypothetical protein|nr:hypothetical protein [Micromonosporaceae bacterium]
MKSVGAVWVLAVGSLASTAFREVRGSAIVVALGLGVLAGVAALLRSGILGALAGAGYLAAAVVIVAGQAAGHTWLHGDGSTASIWIGLGAGLVALAPALRKDAPQQRST